MRGRVKQSVKVTPATVDDAWALWSSEWLHCIVYDDVVEVVDPWCSKMTFKRDEMELDDE